MSIQIRNVSKRYGEQLALADVNLEIKSGEVVGFLGPNGAGKSTMMKIITCYLPPTLGEVSVCGFNVMEDPLAVKRKVGYLPEHNPLYLDMYVKEFLQFTGGVHKLPNLNQRIEEMIELVGLQREQHKRLGALSKGYRQRVGLAQAMIHDPEVLILDEPTSGLDPNQLVEIRELIRRIGKEKTVMLSTHIMQEVEAICDRVIIINRGEIVADGPTADIRRMTDAGSTVLRVELDGEKSPDGLVDLPEIISVEPAGKNTWRVKTKGSADARKAVASWAQANDRLILTLNEEEQKLEDVFKQLTS
jgi:ABC-2 type transport system ATP-binding protein